MDEPDGLEALPDKDPRPRIARRNGNVPLSFTHFGKKTSFPQIDI